MHDKVMKFEPEKICADLAKIIKGDVFSDILHRAAFSTDASIYQIIPACVIAPKDAADISAAVKYASKNNIPLAPRGAASGVAGESLTSGILFDTCRYMNKIIGYDPKTETITAQPGIALEKINEYLLPFGRKIGPDPSSADRAALGGCVANNATGAHSLAFGYIADFLESVEAVLPDGSMVTFENNLQPQNISDPKVAQIASDCIKLLADKEQIIQAALPRTKRNRSGYNIAGVCHDGKIDLAKLLAGSEGTLCIFTQITLKTVPLPKCKALVQFEFDSLEKMAFAVPVIVQSGACACELMDNRLVKMAIESFPKYSDVLPKDALVSLLVEHIGDSEQAVKEKIDSTVSAVSNLAAKHSIVFNKEHQKLLWKARKDAVPLLARHKGKKHPAPFIEDAAVENSKLAEYISGLEKISQQNGFEIAYYGHAGDGELHIRPYLDLSDPSDVWKMKEIADRVFKLVWSLGGSISGEHADGLVRAPFVKKQYGQQFYQLLEGIKRIFDPADIMNPGKIINPDADIMTKNLRSSHKFRADRLESDLHFDENELAFEIDQCSGCGLCLSDSASLRMCPVYRALGQELGSSRAKANILRFWATGQLSESDFASEDFDRFLGLCINCKACSINCPSGVDISKIMIAARTQAAKRKRLSLTRKILSRNRYLGMLGTAFAPVSNFAMSLGISKWFMDSFIGIDKRRAMPKFEKGSFVNLGRRYLKKQLPLTNPQDKVAYFVDTYANYNDHALGFAVLKVLRHNNIEIIIPDQLPAPLPSIVYGDIKPARKELQYNVTQLAKAVKAGYKIVCSEPSAAVCLKDQLRHFVDSPEAKLVSQNSFELMSYLLSLYKKNKLKPAVNPDSAKYLYHCPCHLLSADSEKASMELLTGLCGADIADLNAGCCGIAGTFGMQKKNYPLSADISKKLRNAVSAQPKKTVLTECGTCKMQIEHIAKNKVIHPVKILVESYGL